MTKALRKAIISRSKPKNIYNKKRSYDNWDKYKKQRNFCVKLLRKTKRTTSIILILKVSVIRENSETRLNLISATKN